MPLSIRDIEYFLAVAKTGLLSAAADELGVTQSALTKAVQRVEAEFDLPLFERSARGMALTSAGQRMLGQAHRLRADYADLVLLANEMRARQSGLLRVGVTDTTAGNRVALALGSLLAQRPGLRVHLRVDRSDALAALLHEGALDLALVPVYEGQRLDADRTRIDQAPVAATRARGPGRCGRLWLDHRTGQCGAIDDDRRDLCAPPTAGAPGRDGSAVRLRPEPVSAGRHRPGDDGAALVHAAGRRSAIWRAARRRTACAACRGVAVAPRRGLVAVDADAARQPAGSWVKAGPAGRVLSLSAPSTPAQDMDIFLAHRLLLHQRIACLPGKRLKIPQRPAVGGQHLEQLATGHVGQGLFRLEDRKGAVQAPGIDFFVNVHGSSILGRKVPPAPALGIFFGAEEPRF